MPEKMSLVRIIAPIDYIEEAVFALIESKVFHVSSKPGKGLLADRFRRNLVLVEEALSRLEQYLSITGIKLIRRESEQIEIRPDSAMVFLEEITEKIKIIDTEFEDLLNKYREAESRLYEYESMLDVLNVFREVDVNIDHILRGEFMRIKLFMIPKDRVDILKSELRERIEHYVLIHETPAEDKNTLTCSLLYPPENENIINEILRSNRARVIDLPQDLPRNIARVYEVLSERVNEFKRYLRELSAEARDRFNKTRDLFVYTYKGLVFLRDFLRICSHGVYTSSHVYIEGFVPSREKKNVSKRLLDETRGNIVIEFREINRLDKLDEDPPTHYKIPKHLEPFKMIPDLYGTPSYNEVVPIYIVAATFPIIFGLMFPDLGHGLAILITGIIFWRIIGRENKGYRDLGNLLIYLGVASMITGFLAGEFFGPATYVSKLIEGFYEEIGIHPPLSLPIYSTGASVVEALYFFILLSIRIATLTLFVSTLLGVINSVISKEFDYLIALALPRFIIFTSLAVPAYISNDMNYVGSLYNYISLGQLLSLIGFTTSFSVPLYIEILRWVLDVSLLWIILGECLVECAHGRFREAFSKIGDGFIEMFDTVLMAVGNSMSYLRIMGIALAHIAVVVSFYMPVLGLLSSPNPLEQTSAWIIYSIGNLLAMSLEAVIAFAHTLRLHLYEMFSKFYKGQGRLYEPVKPISIMIL